jgi:hypothetical protein
MRLHSIGTTGGCMLAALLLSPLQPVAADPAPASAAGSLRIAQFFFADFEYRRKLAEYTAARQRYEAEADAYWSVVGDKRRLRMAKRRSGQQTSPDDYVLTQPPVYSGPPPPVDPSAPEQEPPARKYVPVVADFLSAAAQEFNFAPQPPQSEIEYKRAYAKVAAAAGLTRDQVVRIYGFESGGDGKYDVQAGLEYPRPNARAISTALGYNQLMAANSVELLAEKGDYFIKALNAKAVDLTGDAKKAFERKVAVVRAMIAFSRTVPDDWNAHERLANTSKGLGIHALNLDKDVGPLLQTQKLLDSVVYARRHGYAGTLSAAELEMMNLTGDGNGLDMVMMPLAWRDRVPTSNFFRQGGYERNRIASRANVVAKLLAETNSRMDEEARLQGAKDLAAVFPRSGAGEARNP